MANITTRVNNRIQFEKFVRHIQAVSDAYFGEYFPNQMKHISYEEGSVYWRIVTADKKSGGGRSVYGFVRKEDGAIFKAASWKAPAVKSGIRGSIYQYEDKLLGAYGIAYKKMGVYGPSVYPPRPE